MPIISPPHVRIISRDEPFSLRLFALGNTPFTALRFSAAGNICGRVFGYMICSHFHLHFRVLRSLFTFSVLSSRTERKKSDAILQSRSIYTNIRQSSQTYLMTLEHRHFLWDSSVDITPPGWVGSASRMKRALVGNGALEANIIYPLLKAYLHFNCVNRLAVTDILAACLCLLFRKQCEVVLTKATSRGIYRLISNHDATIHLHLSNQIATLMSSHSPPRYFFASKTLLSNAPTSQFHNNYHHHHHHSFHFHRHSSRSEYLSQIKNCLR